MTLLNPPEAKDWLAAYSPQVTDFNTYIRDTFDFLASPPAFRAVATVGTSVPSNLWTGIEVDSVLEDTYSGWQSPGSGANNYQAQVPGWYAITWTVFAPVPSGSVAKAGLQFDVAGVTAGPFDLSQSEGGSFSPWGWDCYDEIHLSTGDSVQPFFNQLTAGTISTVAGSSLEIVWISE
jgi:hypothetical protein